VLILKPSRVVRHMGDTIDHVRIRSTVEQGSLDPALHRVNDRGWIASFWRTFENNQAAFTIG
jgi:PadR family transcriptional regulator, regulatory protein PadR